MVLVTVRPPKKHPAPAPGEIYAVPLSPDGYATAVIAGSNGQGKTFGYFFGPKALSVDQLRLHDLLPEDATLRSFFGDLGIIKGEWKKLPSTIVVSEAAWPVSPTCSKDEHAGAAYIRHYDYKTLKFLREVKAPLHDPKCVGLPADGLMGYGAVQKRLSKLLAGPNQGGG